MNQRHQTKNPTHVQILTPWQQHQQLQPRSVFFQTNTSFPTNTNVNGQQNKHLSPDQTSATFMVQKVRPASRPGTQTAFKIYIKCALWTGDARAHAFQ